MSSIFQILDRKFPARYRVKRDHRGFYPQYRPCYWPFWLGCAYYSHSEGSARYHETQKDAEKFAVDHAARRKIWNSRVTPHVAKHLGKL